VTTIVLVAGLAFQLLVPMLVPADRGFLRADGKTESQRRSLLLPSQGLQGAKGGPDVSSS
jgi:hypothetical protein